MQDNINDQDKPAEEPKKLDIQEINIEDLEDISGGGGGGTNAAKADRPYHMNTGHVPELG